MVELLDNSSVNVGLMSNIGYLKITIEDAEE